MNTTARSTLDAYYAHAPEQLDILPENLWAAARYIYSKNPPTDTASQFSIVYPLKATMVSNIRVGAARTSRIPLRIGPALVWLIDRTTVSPKRCLQVLTTCGPGAGLEVYALLFAERAVEVTSWFPKVHAWRKDLAYGLRPAAASKLEADLATFLDRYPDCPSPLELSGLKTWALESGNLLGRYFLDKFTFGVNLLDGKVNISFLDYIVETIGWSELLQAIGRRVFNWHSRPELDRLQILDKPWESYNQLLEGIKAALRGTHPEVPRPDLLFHDTATTPIPPPVMAEVIRACGRDTRFLGIVHGIEALGALKEACEAARVPLHVLQEAEAYRPRSVGFMFLVGNWPFAQKRRRHAQKRLSNTSSDALIPVGA